MDTLSSLMEVKLDIREKRTEWLPLRSWTRCYIKIEAIKCFPCYIKITFHKSVTENDNGLVLRINIPGLDIYPVKSRTKEFAYGLFWKQNRKSCMAFLSLDSKLSMEAHLQWVYCQIQSLETFRREVLQSSRCSRIEQSLACAEDSGIYQNMNETCQVRDVKEILGPLPAVPNGCVKSSKDYDKNWSRRMSALSGIYEEIVEPSSRPKFGRGSAIYEEMRLNRPEPNTSPPPLPPRVRKNTDCSTLQRSYTTPESEMVKKKWSLFENVFGKSKRPELKRRERQAVQPRELQLLKTKRNSFSSPDLSHLDVSFNNPECGNCSFDLENPSNISASNSYELENLCEEEAEHMTEQPNNNISRNIKPNFVLTLDNNMSSVNLVGSNLGVIEDASPQTQPSSSPPGYLEMRPGRGFDMKKVEELDIQLKNDVLYRLKYSFDSPITYKREFDYDVVPPAKAVIYTNKRNVESHYVCMTKGTKISPPHLSITPRNAEPTYMSMNRIPAVVLNPFKNVQNNQTESSKVSCGRTPKRHSVDEKIASYYPNYDVPIKCNGSPSIKSSTCQEVVLRRSPPKIITPEATEGPKNDVRQNGFTIETSPRKGKRLGSFSSSGRNDNNNNGKSTSSEISKKYATFSRVTVKNNIDDHHHHLSPTTIKKSGSISPTSIKRFASLPRFKKLDFSPLRLKISSVLQRNNAGGC